MEQLTNLFLRTRSLWNSTKNYFFDVESVKVYLEDPIKSVKIDKIDKLNRQPIKDYTFRFYILRYLIGIEKYVGNLSDRFDINKGKIHLTKKNKNGKKSIIVDLEDSTLKDVILELDKRTKIEEKVDSKIVTVFKLDENCIKHIAKNYKEHAPINDHTLENILLFNELEYNKESIIQIEYFEKGKIVKLEYKVIEIAHLHINNIVNTTFNASK